MPYVTKGKCIRKADSKKRVGCTKGSVKKYLTALRMHVNESTTGVDYKFLMNKTLIFNPPIDKENYYNRLIPTLKLFNVLWFDGMPLEEKDIYRIRNTFKFVLFGNKHFDSGSQDNWVLSIVEDDEKMDEYVTNEEYTITGNQYVESEKIDGWDFLNNYGDIINFNPFENLNESEEDELSWAEEAIKDSPIIMLSPGSIFKCNHEEKWELQVKILKISESKVDYISRIDSDGDYRYQNKLGQTDFNYAVELVQSGYWTLVSPENSLFNKKSIKESEEFDLNDFGWVEDIFHKNETIDIKKQDDLKPGDIILINGEFEGLGFDDSVAKILDTKLNEDYDYDILVEFKQRMEDDSATHCGNIDFYEICGCNIHIGESGVGKCYFLNVSDSALEIKKLPNRMSLIENKQNLLNEGRYDSLTRKVVIDIMNVVKSTKEQIEYLVQADLPTDLREEEFEYSKDGVTFSVDLNVHHQQILTREAQKETEAYYVHTAISDDIDENVIMITVVVDPAHEPQIYEKLFYKLQEDIRHEIEHLTQENPDDTSKLKTTYGHHKNMFEIPALVHGFYRRAKLEKRPLDDIMIEDLDSEIERGNLSSKQAQKLLRIWVDYAKKNLPHAQYSGEY